MVTWKGKTRGNSLGYRIFIFTIKYLGLSVSYFLLRIVSFYFLFFSPKSFKSLLYFYNTVLNYKYFKSVLCIYKNYVALGKSLIDKTALLGGFKQNFKFTFDGENYLRQMAAENGGLLISAHVGNFEMASGLLKRINTKINIVILDAEHEKIKKIFNNILQINVNFIPLKNDMSHLFLINKAIENKEIVCLHGDRFVDNERVFEMEFLNKKATFPSGPFQLAMLYKVPVSFVFAMNENKNKYHYFASKPKIYNISNNRNNRHEEFLNITNDYKIELEKIVKQYPIQWFNHYQFWKL